MREGRAAMTIKALSSLSGIAAGDWNKLAGDNPFLRHEFLHALHETGCACENTGWAPRYLTTFDGKRLTGAMPLYLKMHSRGEFVFDWAWADAYERNGLEYYPKLLAAVPFTPVCGQRILAESDAVFEELADAALAAASDSDVSSFHCLFPPREQADALAARGMMLRHGVQFHWANAGDLTFDQYLAHMNHTKRKKIKQERRKVRDAGITFRWIDGADIVDDDWTFFVRCYNQTYREHHSLPYLNLDFFRSIGRTMPENLLLIVAERGGKRIGASFNMHNGHQLFGRYWGAIEHHPALHFEACYYQVIEYCISRGIQVFEGGAQGAHKMARGLMPVETCSVHWLAHPQFAAAIEQFLAREARGVASYIDELHEHSPFRADAGNTLT